MNNQTGITTNRETIQNFLKQVYKDKKKNLLTNFFKFFFRDRLYIKDINSKNKIADAEIKIQDFDESEFDNLLYRRKYRG